MCDDPRVAVLRWVIPAVEAGYDHLGDGEPGCFATALPAASGPARNALEWCRASWSGKAAARVPGMHSGATAPATREALQN